MSARARHPGRVRGHQARKRFGQHFLTDQSVIEQLLASINPRPGDKLIEIGPGLGALTAGLVQRAGHITAVELDRDLADKLRNHYRPDQLSLVQADALRADWGALTRDGGARIVGNLPYNISTPLLVRLIDCVGQVADQHFMLQREVVERIVATSGSNYGRLGVMMQAFYSCESILDVPPDAFNPPPRVDSAVVRMRPLAGARVTDAGQLGALLLVAFGQRRKMLRRTLLPWLTERGVPATQIDPTWRAEQVPPQTYFDLANALAGQ